MHERGLDAFLSRSAPGIDQKLNTSNYKNYRARLDLYHRQVKRKGKEALIDGAFLLTSLLQPLHPDLVENLDCDAMEASADGVAYIIALLNKSFKYGQEVELPLGRHRQNFLFLQPDPSKGTQQLADSGWLIH